jgi:cysteinyl-tRNA synthetase
MSTYRDRFTAAIADDLGLPAALATAHAVASADDLTPAQRRALLLDFDRVLGLDLDRAPEPTDTELPEGAAALLERRAAARAARDYATSDALREELAALGVEVRDMPDGQVATRRRP